LNKAEVLFRAIKIERLLRVTPVSLLCFFFSLLNEAVYKGLWKGDIEVTPASPYYLKGRYCIVDERTILLATFLVLFPAVVLILYF
jgi:hypothetical protein